MTEHRRDPSALDDLLRRQFAASAAAIADDGFSRAIGDRLRRRRRLRRLALGAAWAGSATACLLLLPGGELLAGSWRGLAQLIGGEPTHWGPLLALLLVGVLSLATTQGTVDGS